MIKTIGLCHGVFDVLHVGHLEHFLEAKKYCDYLIVSVTSDKYVKISKGVDRPLFNQTQRIKLLQNLRVVDKVILSDSSTALSIIKRIKPNFYFKGKDYSKLIKNKNLQLEFSEVKKNNGKIIITKSSLSSSSYLINNFFKKKKNYLDQVLNKNNKINFFKKVQSFVNTRLTEKILVIGEQIIDTYVNTYVQGKSGKTNILTSGYINNNSYGGGTILVANMLSSFLENVELLCFDNSHNNLKYKKFLNPNIKKINFKTNLKLIEKKRFQDNYSKNKLFQINSNQEKDYNLMFNNKFNQFLKKKDLKKYKKIFIFDYGHGLINKETIKILNKYSSKIYINCQSNSYNYGYNLFSKYKKGRAISMDELEFRLVAQDKLTEMKTLIKSNLKFMKKFKNVLITMGKNGAYIYTNNKLTFVKSITNSTNDTTGCGDIFFSMFGFLDCNSKFNDIEKVILSHLSASIHADYEGNKNILNKDNFINFFKNYLS